MPVPYQSFQRTKITTRCNIISSIL